MDYLLSRQIKYFLEVANSTSLIQAARKLRISQPSLTVAIQNLEEEVGTPLIERRRDGIRLTATGEAFYQKTSLHINALKLSLAESLTGAQVPTLKIGSIDHFASQKLFSLVRNTTDSLNAQLFLNRSGFIFEAVERGQLDFGFVSWSHKPKKISSIFVQKDPTRIMGLKDQFASIKSAKSIDELRDHPWVHTPKPQNYWASPAELSSPKVLAGGFFAQKEAILAGMGIGEVQTNAYTSAELKRLVAAPIKSFNPDAAIYLIFRNDLRKEIRESMDVFRKRL